MIKYIVIPCTVLRNTRLSSLKEESDRQERMSHNSEPNKSSVVTCSTAVPTPGGVTEVKGKYFPLS